MIKSPFYKFDVIKFNDGTPRIRLAYNEKKTVGGHATLYWYYDASCYADELFQLGCMKDLLADIGVNKVTLIMPYIPNARMDRKQGKDAFTLRTFAKMINAMNFDKVIVFDPHSDVAPALIDRCEVHTVGKLVDKVIDRIRTDSEDDGWYIDHKNEAPEVVVFPDAGAEHKYSADPEISYFLKDNKFVTGNKVRDWESSWILGYTLINGELVRGKTAVIVDDIIAHGFTMKYLIDALKKYEPKDIVICCSHLEDSYFQGALVHNYPEIRIHTTDSIVRTEERNNVTVHKIGGLL